MKLRNYLLKQDEFDDPEIPEIPEIPEEQVTRVISMIKSNCKPFLQEIKGTNGFLYRGTRKNFQDLITEITPRKERKPLASPQEWHDWADDYFMENFGWPARSQGVFVAGDIGTTKTYGKEYLFFPIGRYRYVWSPKIDDFWTDIGLTTFEYFQSNPDKKKEIMNLMKTYTNRDLRKYLTTRAGGKYTRNEMMFKCKKYYLVDIDMERYLEKELFT